MCVSADCADDVLGMVGVIGHPFAGGDVSDDFADACSFANGVGIVGLEAMAVAQECRPCAIELRVLRTWLVTDAIRSHSFHDGFQFVNDLP